MKGLGAKNKYAIAHTSPTITTHNNCFKTVLELPLPNYACCTLSCSAGSRCLRTGLKIRMSIIESNRCAILSATHRTHPWLQIILRSAWPGQLQINECIFRNSRAEIAKCSNRPRTAVFAKSQRVAAPDLSTSLVRGRLVKSSKKASFKQATV